MSRLFAAAAVLCAWGCASASGSPSALGGPGSKLASFARALNILPASPRACPGDVVSASYEVRLDGGTILPLRETDVANLVRRGVAASPARNGGWQTSPDVLSSANSGFRLSATLDGDSTVRGDTVVIPTYGCRRPAWGLAASSRYADRLAHVRLGVLSTPFYDSVVVAVFEVPGRSPSVTILEPGELRDGAVRINASGANGASGRAGARGESGGECSNGGDGQDGEPGQDAGHGGEVDIIVEAGAEWLANLVSVMNAGGHGGAGGFGGAGGAAGTPSKGSTATCTPKAGRPGRAGIPGRNGDPGPPPRVTSVPLTLLWSASPVWSDSTARRVLSELIQYTIKTGR